MAIAKKLKRRGIPLIVCAALFAFSSPPAVAVPAADALISITQPDGITSFEARLIGDEFYHLTETADGYVVICRADGWWCYAIPDGAGDLIESPALYGLDFPPGGALPYLRADPAVVEQRVLDAKRALGYIDVQLAPPPPAPPELALPAAQLPPAEVEPVGTVKNLVILCRFNDHTTTTHCRPASEYGPLFNQDPYTSDGAVGSVRKYYSEVSYGNLNLQSTIAAGKWVTLPQTEAYYGADQTFPAQKDLKINDLITDAINEADTAGVDFSQFDTDGDGWIDAIDIIHSGYGQEAGAPSTAIWSKRGWLGDTNAVQVDGVWISGYHTEPALRGNSARNIIRIGVICHETGHFFGLPDLYDTDAGGSGGSGSGVGAWGLMASGSWGADGSTLAHQPVHMCGWCKTQLGWIVPVALHTVSNRSIVRVENTPEAYVIREGFPNAEHFLITNRQRWGFDSSLLGSGGLEILHVDESNLNNNRPYDLHVTFEEADGNWSLMKPLPPPLTNTGSRAQSGDPWNSGTQTAFSGSTTPNSNSNPSLAGSPTSISLSSISANGSPMTFSVQTLVPTLSVLPSVTTTGSYSVTWTASSGSPTQYQIQEATTTTATGYTDNCNSETVFRNDWIVRGAVRRVVPPGESDSVYVMQLHDPGTGTFYDEFQSLKLQRQFLVTTSTTIQYNAKFGFWASSTSTDAGVAYLQIRRAGASSWTTLRKFSSYGLASWATNTESGAPLTTFAGSLCELRFIVINNAGTVYSWYPGTWPHNGLAIEDFSVNNAQIPDFSWSTLSSNATSPYAVSKSSSGSWFYRVRAFAAGAWQDWSNVGQVRVNLPPPVTLSTIALRDDDGANSPSLEYTNGQTVDVILQGVSGFPNQMWLSESPTFASGTGWVSFQNPTSCTFQASTNGLKTVYVKIGDGFTTAGAAGNISDTITLDTVRPGVGSTASTPDADHPWVDLTYDEPVDYGVLVTGNYSASDTTGPLTIQSVTHQGGNTYRLVTDDQVVGAFHSVTVSGVADLAGNLIDPTSDTAMWTGVPVVVSRFELD